MAEDKYTKITNYTDLHDKAVQYFYDNYWKSAKENIRFRKGKHWTTSEEGDHTSVGRLPYSMPLVESKCNVITGQQAQTPYSFKALPRTAEDEVNAEVKNVLFKYIEDTNLLKYVVSEFFNDGTFKKYGVLKRYIDKDEDIQGDIKVKKIMLDYFVWDTNCKEFDIARKATWCQEFGFMTKDELKAEFPEKESIIDKLPESTAGQDSQNITGYHDWRRTENGTELIKVVWHYERKWDIIYKVVMQTPEGLQIVDREKRPTEQEIDELRTAGIVVTDIIRKKKAYIDVTCFTKDAKEELDNYRIESSIMPFHVFFSFFDDGDFWCLMDLLKHPQKFLDRLTSQIDYSIGTMIKNNYGINWNAIHKDDKENWENIKLGLVKGGEFIRTIGTDPAVVIRALETGRVPPEIFTTWQYAVQVLEDVAGGRNFQGASEGTSQSGVMVKELKEQGFVMMFPVLFNLRRALQSLGEGLNEDINEVYGNSIDRILTLTDDELDTLVKEQFMQSGMMQESPMKPGNFYMKVPSNLGEARTRIVVELGEYAPTDKQRKLNNWLLINQQRVQSGQQPYPIELFINEFGFDATTKRRIKEFEEQQKKQQEEMMQKADGQQKFENNLAQQKEIREGAKTLGEQYNMVNQNINPEV